MPGLINANRQSCASWSLSTLLLTASIGGLYEATKHRWMLTPTITKPFSKFNLVGSYCCMLGGHWENLVVLHFALAFFAIIMLSLLQHRDKFEFGFRGSETNQRWYTLTCADSRHHRSKLGPSILWDAFTPYIHCILPLLNLFLMWPGVHWKEVPAGICSVWQSLNDKFWLALLLKAYDVVSPYLQIKSGTWTFLALHVRFQSSRLQILFSSLQTRPDRKYSRPIVA